MKNILIVLICNGILIADITMSETDRHKHLESRKVDRNNVVIQENNFYNNNCEEYILKVSQQEKEILALQEEVKKLKNHTAEKLQKEIKDAYEAKVQKAEAHESTIKTKSSIIISDTKN